MRSIYRIEYEEREEFQNRIIKRSLLVIEENENDALKRLKKYKSPTFISARIRQYEEVE